jgi:transcriptional regulator with XRE-family HTH domain
MDMSLQTPRSGRTCGRITSEVIDVTRLRRASVNEMSYVAARPAVGALLRDWRQRRRMTQMDLALEADVSARHLSFIETGRSTPSAEMVKHLAEQLDVPLRERNELLLAAGYAPAYGQRDLDEPEMGPVREAIERVLKGHEPFPAVVVDRHWGMVAGNSAIPLLTAGVAEHLLAPPVNVLRLTLHPEGMAPKIANLPEWRAHLLDRLGRQVVTSGDPALAALHEELVALPGRDPTQPAHAPDLAAGEIAVPLRIRHGDGELCFISTYTTFGTAVDVTVSELSIEAFFPADDETARVLQSR